MNNRQRLLAIMDGKTPDRIPWIPRLLLWYNAHKKAGTLPDRYRSMTLREIERDLGLGTPARDGFIFRKKLTGVEVKQRRLNEWETLTEYETPVGTVTTLQRGSDYLRQRDLPDLLVGHMLKRQEDYAVVEYMIEHTTYTPAYEDYLAYEREIGDDGYPLVQIGDCPLHHFLRELCGYNDGYLHLNDYTNEVEHLFTVLEQRDRETVWKMMAESPARLYLHGMHFSSQMTPPPVFSRYIEPYYRDLSALMRAHGKTLTLHGDNDTRHILGHIERAGYAMVECFATFPMVPTTLAEARAAWGDRIIIWGGVPSYIIEEQYSDAEFEAYMDEIFCTIAPGKAFILGVADNVLPGGKIERVRRISQMVEERGAYPIKR
jgi:hypothetical protein